MSPLELLALLLAGVGAGAINAVVGSGTLITFPTLLALGVPPVTANMSNSLGMVPGTIAGAYGYRAELRGQRARILRLIGFAVLGGVVGAVLLIVLPPGAFEAVVPVLIGLGITLVVLQPRLARAVAARTARRAEQSEQSEESEQSEPSEPSRQGPPPMAPWLPLAVFATGVYGGYFGAAQGVLLMGALGIGVADTLQRLNGLKNVLVTAVNLVAGLLFVALAALLDLGDDAHVDWLLVAVIAVGAMIGGLLGAAIGRRLPPIVLRTVIVVVGLVAIGAIVIG